MTRQSDINILRAVEIGAYVIAAAVPIFLIVAVATAPTSAARTQESYRLVAACAREHDLVKVTLDTALSLSRHHADSEPFQYKAAGQMETMFRVCFADPDRDSPESPGILAVKLGDLTEDELAQVEADLDQGWRASTIGQPWRGAPNSNNQGK